MSIEDLSFAKKGVENNDVCGGLSNEPIATTNVDRLTVQCIGIG